MSKFLADWVAAKSRESASPLAASLASEAALKVADLFKTGGGGFGALSRMEISKSPL